jgi:hypothetical protein
MRIETYTRGTPATYEVNRSSLRTLRVTSIRNGLLTAEARFTDCKASTRAEGRSLFANRHFPDRMGMIVMDILGRVKQLRTYPEPKEVSPLDAVSRAMEHTCEFPERALRVGDTWSADREIPQPRVGTVRLHFARKLAALESRRKHDCARIETRFSGTVLPKATGTAQELSPRARFGSRIRFSGSGVSWFDHRRGLSVEIAFSVRLVMPKYLPASPSDADGGVNQPSKTTVTMSSRAVLQD